MASLTRPPTRAPTRPVTRAPGGAGRGGSAKVWAADNRGASISEQGTTGGANISWIGSRPRSLPFDLRRFRVVTPVFLPKTISGSNISDTLFADVRTFAQAICPWQDAVANRPAGTPVTYGGQPSCTFDPGAWNPNAALLDGYGVCIVSDLIDLGVAAIPAGTRFEWRSGVKAATAGQIPISYTVNGTMQTLHGTRASATDIVSAGIGSQMTFTSLPGSDVSFWDNTILLAEGPAGTHRVIAIGDSKLHARAYDYGDIEGVGGIIPRGCKAAGAVLFEMGRGSDGDFNLVTASNWAMRYKLTQVVQALGAAFDQRFHANVHNDISKTYSIVNLARSTAYALDDHVFAAGLGSLICTQAGTTDSAALSIPGGVNRDIADGTVRWARLTSSTSGTSQFAAKIAAQSIAVNRRMRELMPGVPAWGVTADPATTTKTSGVPLTNWGSETSRRGLFNALLRDPQNWDLWRFSGVLDFCPVIEQGYPPSVTSLWSNTDYTPDGTHHSSAGAVAAAPVVQAAAAL